MALSFGKNKNRSAGMSRVASMQDNPAAALEAMRAEMEQENEADARIRGDIFKMIDQGTGSVTDLWAPPRMKILFDCIELGDEAISIFTVSNWPTSLSYGWLNSLLDDVSLTDVKIDVSMHIHPVRKEYALKYMQDKYNSAASSAEAEIERGKVKESNQLIYTKQKEAAQFVTDMLSSGNENMFQVSLVFGIYGQTIWDTDEETGEEYVVKSANEDLAEKANRFKKVLATKSGGGFAIKPLLHQQRDGIKSLLPWGYGGLHAFQNFYTSALATCYPFTQGSLQVEDGILYGTSLAADQPIFFDIFNHTWMNSYNQIIIGTKGSGKSATAKTLLGRYAIMGTQIFIIDPAITTDGEYTNLCTSLEGALIDFGGKDGVYINPFELAIPGKWNGFDKPDDEEASQIYLTKKNYIIGLIDLMRKNYDAENPGSGRNLEAFSSVLSILLDRTYQYKKIQIASGLWDYSQWDPNKMPTIDDFYTIISHYENIVNQYKTRDAIKSWGTTHLNRAGALANQTSKTDRITFGYYRHVINSNNPVWGQAEADAIHYLKNIVAGYAMLTDHDEISEKTTIFHGTHKADLSNQCIVFRLGKIKSETMKAISTYLTFELINSRITAHMSGDFKNKIIVLDEAWKLISSPAAREYLSALYREGRKTNSGIWLISQSYNDFQNENKIFFDFAETKIIMSVPDSEVNMLMSDIELSPYLADVINADRGHTSSGCGILHVSGKRKESVAFYCDMTQLEAAIADTSDSTHPPLTVEDMIGTERAMQLGLI